MVGNSEVKVVDTRASDVAYVYATSSSGLKFRIEIVGRNKGGGS